MNRFLCLTCALAVLFLSACGGSKSTSETSPGAPAAAPTGAATAEQVAEQMRGNVKCPATASTQRPAGAPVDDVTGVRPGISWNEAANFVMCDNPLMVVAENTSRGYNINTFGQHIRQGFDGTFAQPRVVKTGQQIMQDMEQQEMQRGENAYIAPLQPGQSRYFVSTMGLPGQEQVLSVAREEYYVDAKQPTVDSVKQALIAKYGNPTRENDGASTYLWWEYDPSGTQITQASPLAGQCSINVSPDAATNLSTACGVTVGALIQASPANPGLAHSLAVNSQNGAQDMAVLKSTQDTLQNGDNARKANELNDASKNASKPTL
jgi:hypothetical protein